MNVTIRCVLNPGDEALVLTPAWPNAAANIRIDNAVPMEIPLLLRGDHYVVDFDSLEAAVTSRHSDSLHERMKRGASDTRRRPFAP